MATNNEQFRLSITTHIKNVYERKLQSLAKAEKDLKENPRAAWAKLQFERELVGKQSVEFLIHHIEAGNYDDVEYYDTYLNPNSEYQLNLKK